MRKMGESQIIDFFSGYLKDALRDDFGASASYTMGNFSGSQDRKFSDFFAGTSSSNILIEFKEKKAEYEKENEKPLRKKLCLNLNETVSTISRKCHFIGWGRDRVDTEVEFAAYIDLVCRLWNVKEHLLFPGEYGHEDFANKFIAGMVGVDHDKFVEYIEHLNKTAGGDARGDDVPFRSILYSRGENGRLVGTRFENLGELKQLRQLVLRRQSPRGPSGSSGPGMSP